MPALPKTLPNKEVWDEMAKVLLDMPNGIERAQTYEELPLLDGSVAEAAMWGCLAKTYYIHSNDENVILSLWAAVFFKHWFARRGYRVTVQTLSNGQTFYARHVCGECN